MVRVIGLALFVIGVSASVGCSDASTPTAATVVPVVEPARTAVRLNEGGLIAAVGSGVAYEYELDDGRGLNFRPRGTGPDFKLEFRSGRVNVAWSAFNEPPTFGAMNEENRQWALKVLTYALGPADAAQVMKRAEAGESGQLDVIGHRVNVMAGKPQTLVSITR